MGEKEGLPQKIHLRSLFGYLMEGEEREISLFINSSISLTNDLNHLYPIIRVEGRGESTSSIHLGQVYQRVYPEKQ